MSLTPAGARILEEARRRYADLQGKLGATLTVADHADLSRILHRLGSRPGGPGPIWMPACEPASGVLDGALSFLTRRALQLFQAQFAASSCEFDLTLRQFSLLFLLDLRSSLTQVAFARLFGLDPSTCAVIMRSLAGRGLIGSTRSIDDQRERVFTITEQGRRVLKRVHPIADRSEAIVLRDFSPAEQEFLVRQLRAVVKAYSPILRFPGAMGTL